MLFCLVKTTWKSVKSVETAIIAGMGLDTPPHQKSIKTNLQNITRDIFQSTMKQLMAFIASPKLSNDRFRASGEELCPARPFFGFFGGNDN